MKFGDLTTRAKKATVIFYPLARSGKGQDDIHLERLARVECFYLFNPVFYVLGKPRHFHAALGNRNGRLNLVSA
jgi:hypothetical protein